MNIQTLSGILLIAGFILFAINSLIAPPKLYQEKDTGLRLQIIADYPSRWQIAQWSGGLSALAIGLGFVLLSLHLLGGANPWLLSAGAAALALAGVFSLLYVRQALADPQAYLERVGFPPLAATYILLTAVGGVLFGLVFLQVGFPTWLGYLTLASGALLILLLVLVRNSIVYATELLF